MKQIKHRTDKNKIIFNLYDKPDINILSKPEKRIVESIKNEIVTDFDSFVDLFLDRTKLPRRYNITHSSEKLKKIRYYVKSYYKTQKLIKEYITVIDFLEKEGYIYLNPDLETPDKLSFLFKERNKKSSFFYDNSLYNDCSPYLNKVIEIDKEAIDEFYDNNCLDEITFWRRRSYKTNFYMAFCIIILSLIMAIGSIVYNQKLLNKTQDIIVNSQTKIDSLEITSPEIKKELSKIDSSLQDIKIQVQHINSKRKEPVLPEIK